jgi:uncharacterized membrane protein YhaH (DUF805 family)
MNWYLEVLKKYAVFDGRARRTEFWMFALFTFLITLALGIVEGVLFGDSSFLSGLYSLGVLLPSVGVGIRRLHDTGRSGWWLLITLIPILGTIVFIVFAVQEGEPGSNDYGANPKEGEAASVM